MQRLSRALALCVLAVVVAIPALAYEEGEDGLVAFTLGDFGGLTRATLETNALPYKLIAAALVIREERVRGVRLSRRDLPTLFRQFGFLIPTRVANWSGNAPLPPSERPLGMVSREVTGPTSLVRIDAANIGCATCHSAPAFDSAGQPDVNVAWIGSPNTSLDLEAYAQAVYFSVSAAIRNPDALQRRIEALFPEMGIRESLTLRWIVLPGAARRMRALQAAGGPLPFRNGGAGRTNGVAAVKLIVGVPVGPVTGHADVGYSSTPELAGRGFRTSLLYDGVYAPIGGSRFEETFDSSKVTAGHLDSLADITVFFIVGTLGAHPNVAEAAIPAMRPVLRWIGTRYRSPPFPGTIDSTLMRQGANVFKARCSNCHGTYGEGRPRPLLTYPNSLIEQSVIETDSSRWAALDTAALGTIARTAYGRHTASQRNAGYVSPILSGVWATAPYLHNGSIPTLAALLWPATRPQRFLVGGHALDFKRVGIAGAMWSDSTMRYPAGYAPWSIPELYDTRLPGQSNAGHTRQIARLSDAEKWAVMEYLKTF